MRQVLQFSTDQGNRMEGYPRRILEHSRDVLENKMQPLVYPAANTFSERK